MVLPIHNMAGHLIRRLQQISTSVFQNRMKLYGFNCTSVQFAALTAIEANPGLDQASLAGMIAYDRATIGGVVDRLEAKGLVRRIISTRDRRAREIMLSEEGTTRLKQMIPIVEAIQTEMLTGLTDNEQKQFLRLAEKLATNANHLSRAPLTSKTND